MRKKQVWTRQYVANPDQYYALRWGAPLQKLIRRQLRKKLCFYQNKTQRQT